MAESKHDAIERSVFLLIVLSLLTISVGGIVEIVPQFFQKSTTTAIDDKGAALDVKPYDPLRLAGRYIYIRECCYNCHSQMIRPFRAETQRYGAFSVAGEFIYDHPFQWGSKRTGPDLARVGGRYSDNWHRQHLLDPRSVVAESNMPAFTWLDRPFDKAIINMPDIKTQMEAMNLVIRPKDSQGNVITPYSPGDIEKAPDALKGKTELDALIAYLQGLGTARLIAQ
ncbi:MAG: cytochrome-c oxidase, cbb3-type subunit II [Betaproteobacteria bacterium]|nr:cytochrome-c oxidase, cbb3-type subunit II [Betaproteobacteria bacterium]